MQYPYQKCKIIIFNFSRLPKKNLPIAGGRFFGKIRRRKLNIMILHFEYNMQIVPIYQKCRHKIFNFHRPNFPKNLPPWGKLFGKLGGKLNIIILH